MSPLTRDDLTTLHGRAAEPAVSIYLPTHRAGPPMEQDRIRLKNLLDEAARQIHPEAGATEPDELLAPARELLGDRNFWRHQSDGLALFLAPGFFHTYRLPISFEERVQVGAFFHLKPLMELLVGDGRFYLLTLSQQRVRLFEGSRDGLKESKAGEDLPKSLADAMGHDHEQRALQFHSGTGPATRQGGKRAAVFHGHGTGSDEEQAEVEQFLRRLGNALTDALGHPSPPLVLAGTEPLVGTFRKLSSYPRLLEKAVSGNHDETPPAQLHAEAWPLVEPLFNREVERQSERLTELLGTGKASTDPSEIVLAAHDGRIEALFVPLRHEVWGRFDPEDREVELHDQEEAEDLDLLNLAAIETLSRGGDVFTLPGDTVAGASRSAAILRY